STTNETRKDNDYKIREEFKKEISSYSGMYFRGLDHIILQKEKNFHALAYITKKNLKKSFERRKNQIQDYVKLGKESEKNCRIGNALKNYYWAYLLSHTYPNTMQINFEGVILTDPKIALPNKIGKVISNISVNPQEVYPDRSDMSDVIAELQFSYMDKPVKDLSFSYYSGLGTDFAQVKNGEAVIPIYNSPTFEKWVLKLSVDYTSERDMSEEIIHLREVAEDELPNNTLEVELEFPWLAPPADTSASNPSGSGIEDFPSQKSYPRELIILARLHNTKDFLRNLIQYRKLGRIIFGTKSDLDSIEKSYVAIVDSDSVWGVFLFDGEKYTEISSGREVEDLSDDFQGKRQIWIESIN
ncbi:MAG: hypothetical protein U9N55_00035, partial [candidate division Zixibacteria bacterium]|nr:hypothetical protein [candidate division Zixibacteria bacterium]